MKKIWIAFFAAMAACTATAKTIAWYHFDEGEIGTKPARGEPVILNAVDNSLYPGKAYQRDGNYVIASGATYMPVYTNAFPASVMWWDPVTGEKEHNGKALFFQSAQSSAYGSGPTVRIEDGGALAPRTLTVECFFKSVPFAPSNCWQTLVLRDASIEEGDRTCEPFSIRVAQDSGGIACDLRTIEVSSDGLTVTTNKVGLSGGKLWRDGNWHHIALVIDDDAKKAQAYVDYKLVKSASFTGTLISDGVTYIGNTYCRGYGTWYGCIDEVRFSDTALDPTQFLRYSVGQDKDVLCYIPFSEQWFGAKDTTEETIWNVASPFLPVELKSNKHGGLNATGQASLVEDVPAEIVRQNITALYGCESRRSLFLEPLICQEHGGTRIVGYGPYLRIDDVVNGRHTALAHSWTLEMFVKPTRSAVTSYYFGKHRKYGLGRIIGSATSNNTEFKLEMDSLEDNAQIAVASVSGLADGNWHHLAVVYDRDLLKCSLYCDYKLAGSKNFTYTNIGTDETYEPRLTIGTAYGGAPHSATNKYDEIRLTARALQPQEFLTCSEYVDVPHAAWMDFEGDLLVDPYTVETPAGQATGAQITSAVGARALANDNGGSGRVNAGALNLNGGKIVYGRNLLIENLENQTIEFFVKGASIGDNYANIVRLTRSEDAANPLSYPIWAITAMTEANEGGLTVRTDTEAGANQGLRAKNINLCDGKWHHVALTYQKTGEDTTKATLWVDYAQVGMANVTGTLKWQNYNTTVLTFGGSTFDGVIDEFRVTPTVLQPEKFLRLFHAGTVLIFR